MPRYLVVANLTLGGEPLAAALRERAAAKGARIHVLVPASSDPANWTHSEEGDTAAARDRLEQALEAFSALGADEVTGEVGAEQPVEAVGDVIRREVDDPFDEIILSTLPPGPSKWLRMDLVQRLRRSTDIPLTHVFATDRLSV